jgi:5-methylcytosine-specific restriction endonuclease McrA
MATHARKFRKLVLSFADPGKWRHKSQAKKLKEEEWQATRQKILLRDDFTC